MTPLTLTVVRRRFVTLTGLRWLGIGSVFPVLIVLLQQRGLPLAEVGAVLALYSAVTVALELPTGGVADVFGARPVLVVATVADLGSLTTILLAPSPGYLYGAAVLLGVGRALASGPLEAWFVNATRAVDPGADIRTGLARAGVAEAGALAVGSLLGGVTGAVVAGPLGVDPLEVPVAVALGAGVLFLVATLVLLDRVVPTTDAPARRRVWAEARRAPVVVRDGVRLAMTSPPVRRLVLAMAAASVPMVVTEVLWQPRTVALTGDSAPTFLLGVLGAGIFGAAAVGAALAPRVGRRFGTAAGRAIVVMVAAQAVAVVGMAVAGRLVAFSAVFLLSYAANGVWAPLHQELTHDHVDSSRRTTVVSTMSMAMHLSGIVTQVTLVPLAAATNTGVAWALAAGIAVLGSLLVRDLHATTGPATAGSGLPPASQQQWELPEPLEDQVGPDVVG